MEAAAIATVAGKATSVIKDKARDVIGEDYADHYSEEKVKGLLLSELGLIQDDLKTLLHADLKTARQAMRSWHDSDEPLRSELRMQDLRRAYEKASSAFNLVKEPTDKIGAVRLIIFASYHIAALGSPGEQPDWRRGKKEAQRRLRQYVDEMKGRLDTAAKDEVRKTVKSRVGRRLFGAKDDRRALLRDFVNLSAAVVHLPPLDENRAHPRFPDLEDAALRACDKDRSCVMLAASIGPFISKPRLRHALEGHDDYVNCCSVFEEGTRAISGSNANTLKVWDLTTGEEMQTLRGHYSCVYCCSVFKNDTRAISGSGDKTLKVWNLATGEVLWTLKRHAGQVTCCSLFEDGTRAISGSGDKTLKVWNLVTGEEMRTLKGHADTVLCCSVSEDGMRAISGSGDKKLKLWNVATGEEMLTLEGHHSGVWCCDVFANGTRAISGCYGNMLKVWNLTTGEEMRTLRGHNDSVKCCSVFANGTRAISGSNDNTLKVWNLATGEEIWTLDGTGKVWCCAVFAQGTKVISGSDTSLKVWDLPSALRLGLPQVERGS